LESNNLPTINISIRKLEGKENEKQKNNINVFRCLHECREVRTAKTKK